MTDYSELKRLAEAALPYGADEKFEAAARPEIVLAMIDEIERYRQYGCDTCDGSGHLHRIDGEYCGTCTSCGAHELEQAKRERDQLKAENEALRAALEAAALAMWNSEANMDSEAADIRDLLAAMTKGKPA